MKRVFLIHTVIVLLAVFLFWFLVRPYTIQWMEGVSFFSTASDFVELQVNMPSDIFSYIGAFFLQFYHWQVVGALIQALFAWIIMACMDITIYCLTKKAAFTALSFVVVAIFIAQQPEYIHLTETVVWVGSALLVALLSLLIKRKKEVAKVRFTVSVWIFCVVIPLLLTGAGLAYAAKDPVKQYSERLFKIESMVESKDWDGVLKEVSATEAHEDYILRRFVLLALIEKDILKEQMFLYGIQNSEDLMFSSIDDSEAQLFNTYFYEALGVENEIIHQMFQISSSSRFGMSFRAMRRMVDSFIRQGNFDLAEKYLIVLNSAPTHRKWVRERYAEMQKARINPVAYDEKDGTVPVRIKSDTPVLSDIVRLVDAYPENRKYVDLLLCGILAQKDTSLFWDIFKRVAPKVYPKGTKLPDYYQEALLLVSTVDNAALEMYPISPEKKKAFVRFVKLMESNQTNMIVPSFPNTYWAYISVM